MSIHHLFSPSSLERRELCPASARMEDGLPDVESVDSVEGTRLHMEMQRMLTDAEYRNKHNDSADPRIQYCLQCFDEVMSMTAPDAMVYAELPLEYRGGTDMVMFNGTADCVVVASAYAHIFDWKFGNGDVTEACDNLQLAAYSLAVMERFHVSSVYVHLIRPQRRTATHYRHANAVAIRDTISHIISRCNAPQACFCPSESACRYCKANIHGTCPAIRKAVDALVLTDAEPTEIIAKMDDDTLAEWYRKSQLVSKVTDALKDEMLKRISEQGSCGGYSTKVSGGGYSVKVDAYLIDAMQEDGIPLAEIYESMSMSHSALVDLWSKYNRTPSITTKDAKKAVNNRYDEFLSQRNPRTTIINLNKEQ